MPEFNSGNQVLQLTGVCKIYETEEIQTHALSQVSLSISQGEFVALTGPSGSGKSTLLSIAGGLERPTSGRVVIAGVDITMMRGSALAACRNMHIGFIFQSFNLIADMTVEENVALPLTYRSGVSFRAALAHGRACLERVGMENRSRHYPGQLSGGQQQRAAVARALVMQPKIILADEPTGNLDSNNASQVIELLQGLHRDGSTILMVTHDNSQAEHAGRVIQMHDGKIHCDHGSLALEPHQDEPATR